MRNSGTKPGLAILTFALCLTGSSSSLGQDQTTTPLHPVDPPASSRQSPPAARPATAPDAVVITVGDLRITAGEVDKMLESFPRNSRPFYAGPGRKQLADLIIEMKLLAKEAELRKLEDREDIKTAINIARESILTDAMRTEMQKEIHFTDEEAQKYMDEHKTQFEEAKVRRIVICTSSSLPMSGGQTTANCLPDPEARAKAEEIRKQLLAGADFEELAAKFSSDSFSSGKGGDLGYLKRGNKVPVIVPPVEEAIFSIKVGSISEVIPAPFGYEIVKVEDRRIPNLSEARKQVEPLLRKQKVDDWVNAMKDKAGVKIDENFFAPVMPASTTHRSDK